jgi:pimeloyl-ACP methyl ester carboxylesterase
MTTIVLVHGAWAGAWSWKGAAKLLRQRGFDVYAPSMTGIAERSHVAPEHVSLASHVADIAGLMRYEELENVLLVGHSYGGMVITGAADREPGHVAGMIYLDAFVPESGQSLWDLVGPQGEAQHRKMAQDFDGGKSVPRPPSPTALSPVDAERIGRMFTPQPIKTLADKFVSVRAEQTWPKRHYILCRAYAGSPFHPIAARVKDAPGWSYGEFDALHDVPRTDPKLVADTIAEIAGKWGLGTG